MSVKLFSHLKLEKVEKQVNSWLETHTDVTVVDIKFNVVSHQDNYEFVSQYSVMIVYEERPEL